MQTKGKVKKATIEATLIKADGSKVNLGTIVDTEKKKGILEILKGKVKSNG